MASYTLKAPVPAPYTITAINVATNVVVHVAILFIVLSFAFALYFSNILKQDIEQSLQSQITSTLAGISIPVPPQAYNALTNLFSLPDPVIVMNNSWLFRMMFTICILLGAFAIIILFYASDSVHIAHLLAENVVTFVVIAIFEFCFFTFVATKYVPSPPSFITSTFISGLRTALNAPTAT